MNKTININLSNLFFHIDEDAYRKLHSYLEAIKHSLNNSQGSDEIIADIEGRIAELFQEKLKSEQQVISKSEVEEVIAVMGQPEDYKVDEEIFADEPQSKRKSKKLYRDTENKYIGGISSGMAHYMGVNPWWIRLLWIVLTFASAGGFIVIYILLLFLIPQAETTAQKLDMSGEAINISNIEKKVKEGFDTVTEKVKNADIKNTGRKFKSSTQTFFDAIGNFFLFIFKSVGKFIGFLFVLIGATVLISLFIGLFVTGFSDAFIFNDIPFVDILNTTDLPIWLVSLFTFFLVGIPFFFLLYLGLKIMVSNLKSIGNIAKFTLLGIWLASIVGLSVLGIKQAKSHMFRGAVSDTEVIDVQPMDTLVISTKPSEYRFNSDNIRINRMTITIDNDGNRLIMDRDFTFNIVKSDDSIARITIEKSSQGPSVKEARQLASSHTYNYSFSNNKLIFDNFLTLAPNSKIRDQEVHAIIYLPVGTILKFENALSYYNLGWSTKTDQGIIKQEIIKHSWKMGENGKLQCLDCPIEKVEAIEKGIKEESENGIDINVSGNQSVNIKINEDGTEVETIENEIDTIQ